MQVIGMAPDNIFSALWYISVASFHNHAELAAPGWDGTIFDV